MDKIMSKVYTASEVEAFSSKLTATIRGGYFDLIRNQVDRGTAKGQVFYSLEIERAGDLNLLLGSDSEAAEWINGGENLRALSKEISDEIGIEHLEFTSLFAEKFVEYTTDSMAVRKVKSAELAELQELQAKVKGYDTLFTLMSGKVLDENGNPLPVPPVDEIMEAMRNRGGYILRIEEIKASRSAKRAANAALSKAKALEEAKAKE